MIFLIVYFIGSVVSYFYTWVAFGYSKTLGTALAAFILGFFSWFGLIFLIVTKGVHKILSSEKEI